MQVRPRDIVPPGDDQPGERHLLRRDAGHRAEGAEPGLGADPAAQRLPLEQGRAQLVEEAQVHGAAGQHPVGPGIVERQDRLRAMGRDHRGEARVDDVERLLPRDALEPSVALDPGAAQGRQQTAFPVGDRGEVPRHLGADHSRGVGIGPRPPHLDDPVILDRDRQAAGVRTIQRAHARVLGPHSDPSSVQYRLPLTLPSPHWGHARTAPLSLGEGEGRGVAEAHARTRAPAGSYGARRCARARNRSPAISISYAPDSTKAGSTRSV